MRSDKNNPIVKLLDTLLESFVDNLSPDSLNAAFERLVAMLLQIALNVEILITITKKALPDSADEVDDDWVNRFSAALYFVATNIPFELMEQGGGAINLAWNLIKQMPDTVTLEVLIGHFKDGYGKYAPSQANMVTPEAIQLAARMLWADWARTGNPDDQESAWLDASTYMDAALEYYGLKLDKQAMRAEARNWVLNASPEELGKYPADMIDMIRTWEESAAE